MRELFKMAGKNSAPEMKKSSFYVWFLGAKESRGLRGEEFISPVVKHLTSREKDQEPIKVTLELSQKGMKIVQNLPSTRPADNYRENIKHFIPNSSLTCAVQEERPNSDIVSVILLIYNPATSCPVHVHSYRCDSPETASLLLAQLNRLIEKPDNQKKFQEIENRLQEKGLLQRNSSSAGSSRLGSDGRSLGRGSDSGAGSDRGSQLNPTDRIASMYDSLAAELREKLTGKEPLLLPPRDYDTMHRSQGNIFGEQRRSLGAGAEPPQTPETGLENCSGDSSGIGSDCNPSSPVHDPSSSVHDPSSPVHEPVFHGEFSSSEDGWDEDVRVKDVLLPEPVWTEDPKPLSSRFYRSSSPSKVKPEPPDCPRNRFKGAKQLFLSLERKKDKVIAERSVSPQRNLQVSKIPATRKGREKEKVSTSLERKQLAGQDRWSRYEKEATPATEAESRWPKSDQDTGYVSRYSRDKSRSRDFDESPPSTSRPNIFTKSGKKTSPDNKDKYTNRRLPRFLSRETLESDGYDKIEEFEEPDIQRHKVKRNPSRTSLKHEYRREENIAPEGPRRGMLRREMTELDLKGYQQHAGLQDGFSRKYIPRQGPIWTGKERALSPSRALSPVRARDGVLATKVITSEYRRDGRGIPRSPDRYPSLDLRKDKRQPVFESEIRRIEPGQDFRRRSYHELSDIDKLDSGPRNFQHSGRKIAPEPLGLPTRSSRTTTTYKQVGEHHRYPGLDRENSRLGPMSLKHSGGLQRQFEHMPNRQFSYDHPANMPFNNPANRPFDHPGNRPAMYRHSYAETSSPPSFARVSPSPLGRFGIASLKPY